MRRYFAAVIIIIMAVILYFKLTPLVRNKTSVYKNGVSYVSMVDNKYFYIYKYGKWQKEFIKGVNIGAAKPGGFPGELPITKEDYLRWFKYIGSMNANTIRVYTILKPDFYDALYEYNRSAIKPLYVMHGVWANEEDISKYQDVYSPSIDNGFREDIKTTIDIIHGNCTLLPKPGHASGIYKSDISKYVTGWILGIEWDPDLVDGTDKNNPSKAYYDGKYVFTKDASPFEAWLASTGDYAIGYETEKYGMQRPLSFTNWVTADMLKHPNEPLAKEDRVSVNTEHIKLKEAFKPGLFASYHIYPYYPDFMNYQHEYISYKDENGKLNPYRAYLKDLIKEHSVPVLVAEFGIPASRGKAHENIITGYNQGDIDEYTQGFMDASMLNDIYSEGYAGGLVFTWQDEWFKRTWNTMDYDIPDKRAYWSNPQTNEQEFGLLAFDPGNEKSVCYVDGSIDEWKNAKPVSKGDRASLYTKSDEKYLYLMADIKDYDEENDKIVIPVDTIQDQGNSSYEGVEFQKPADFIIEINGKKDARVLTDAYYDAFYYSYSGINMIQRNSSYEVKNSGIFNPIYLCLNRKLYLPEDKREIPLSKYETGKLTFGDGNPSHKEYNSLADYCIKGDHIEVRIPWQLLNFMDPSTKMIMDDFYKNGIKPVKTNGIYLGAVILGRNGSTENDPMGFYTWEDWDMPTYHERLKPSYYLLKEAFKKY